MSSERGQTLVAAMVGLVTLSVLIATMVVYTQHESSWTGKQAKSTRAFHLAEAGIEKGFLAITQSTITWVNLQKGTPPTGFMSDVSYRDIPGGSYVISITSGPGTQEATIVSIGIDKNAKETRAIKAIYANATLGNIAIVGGKGVNVSGQNIEVEWGAVLSPNAITTGGRAHPQFWSASSISPQDSNGAAPPNCDQPNCWQWHSYNTGIPPLPTIDFNFYKSSAIASGSGPCGSYYTSVAAGDKSGSCTDTSGKSYYVEKNWTSFAGHIVGNVIVMGNLTTPNGTMGGGNETVSLPSQAWKQYCNDWQYYCTNWNSTAPGCSSGATQCPGLNNTYQASTTENISPVVHGLLYIGGDFTGPTGGGNTDLDYGLIYVIGNVYLNSNSHVKIYYDGGTAANNLQTTQILLTRVSWQNWLTSWPSGLAY